MRRSGNESSGFIIGGKFLASCAAVTFSTNQLRGSTMMVIEVFL